MLSARGTFQGRSRFSTWVCGFVRYVSLESIRKKHALRNRLQRYIRVNPPYSRFFDPETWLLKKERDTCLWGAFYSLSARHRALIARFVLKWDAAPRAGRETGPRRADIKNELDVALAILRRCFSAAYRV